MKVPPVPAAFAEPGAFLFSNGYLNKPSPQGEGAPVRTLGRMRGQILDWVRYTQGGRRPGGEFLFHVEKEPMAQATLSWPFGPIHLEDARGRAQSAEAAAPPLPPCRPSPRPPIYVGTRTCKIEENFRRAKSEWPSKFLPPHWGLAKRKIKAGAIFVLRLALPSSRLLSLGVGAAHWATQFRYEIGPIALLRVGADVPIGPSLGVLSGRRDRF